MYSPFPSSPEQVAVFSPGSSSGSEDDLYFGQQFPGYQFGGSYEQSELQGKLSGTLANRQKRRAATAALPMAPRQIKREYAPPPVVCFPNHFAHISEACHLDSGFSEEGFAPAYDMSSSTSPSHGAFSAPSPATPLSCDELVPTYMPPSSGRIKSTAPNLGLLFSLFDVLESYCEEEASSPFSLQASPCYSPSRTQRAPEARSPPAQVPELLAAPSSKAQAHYYPPSRHYEVAPTYHWVQEHEEVEYDQPLSTY